MHGNRRSSVTGRLDGSVFSPVPGSHLDASLGDGRDEIFEKRLASRTV
jgi:hypothetical protein